MTLAIKLYDGDLSSPAMIEDLSATASHVRFSTKLNGGFHLCHFQLKASLSEAWKWITERAFYRLIITDGTKTIWEGRVQDTELTPGGLRITAYGYYANCRDRPHRTAYNTTADAIIKAALTAVCSQINSDQTNIAATDIDITSAADAGYLDIYVQDLIDKVLAFSDSTSGKWYFAIWGDRIPYLEKRNVTAVDWVVDLSDFQNYRLKHRAGTMWNRTYAVYDAAGLARTADADDTASQTKYGLVREKVIPQLGTVAAAAANAARDGWLQNYKEIYPQLYGMTLGAYVYNILKVRYPSYWVKAGDAIRVRDLVPNTADLDSVTLDALRTHYIIETEYDVDRAELTIVPDRESARLDAVLTRQL